MLDEASLAELEDMIYGRGVWKHVGTGITTHPNGSEDNKRLHAACLALEERGRIKKHFETDDGCHVVWKPGDKGDKHAN